MALRVCLVSRELSPFFGAGIGAYASSMARAWSAAGHEVHVVTGRWPDLETRAPELLPGVHVHRIVARPRWRALGLFDFERYAHGVLERVGELHRQHPFDWVEVPEYWAEGLELVRQRGRWDEGRAALLGARLHSPTRLCRELNDESAPDAVVARLMSSEEEALRGVDVLVSPTKSLLDMVVTQLDLSQTPAWVVPYPFDGRELGRALQEERSEAHHKAQGTPEILYFGRLERRKGVDLLLAAARAMHQRSIDVRVRFVGGDTMTGPGGGSMRAELQRQAAGTARFVFSDPVPREQLARLVRAATTCCFPSRWENFPNACLEAMSLGAAVVGSDSGGMAEIIEHEMSGLLFHSGDVESLTQALTRVVEDGDLRARLAQAAPRRVAALCDPHVVVDRMVQLVRDVRSMRGGLTR